MSAAAMATTSSADLPNVERDYAEIIGFNLHGCLVIDDFSPISVCPSKGLVGPVTSFAPYDPVRSSEWLPSELTALQLLPEPVICLVPLLLSLECLRDMQLVSAQRLPPTSHRSDFSRRLVRVAEMLIEKRGFLSEEKLKMDGQSSTHTATSAADASSSHGHKAVFQKVGKSLSKVMKLASKDHSEAESSSSRNPAEKREAVQNVIESGDWDPADAAVDDSEAIVPDPRSDYVGEVGHVLEFLSVLDKAPELPTLSPASSALLDSLVSLLLILESEKNCSGVVLEVILPEDVSQNLSRETLCEDLVSHFSKSFRTELGIPAVVSAATAKANEEARAALRNGGVYRAAICPIPLKRGDHVYREIREKGALKLVTHHGIYTGNARIIHFSGNELSLMALFTQQKNVKIRSTSILDFMRHGSRLRVVKYKQCDPDSETIQRAEASLVEQSFPDYDIFKNNCEHFCHYCKTGRPRSKQVEKSVQYGAGIAAGGVVLTAAVVGLAMALSKKGN